MADLNRMKDECDEKLMLFDNLLSRYNPTGLNLRAVQENQQKWDDELSNALNSLSKSVRNMTTKHKVALGTEATDQWNQHVKDSVKKYCNYVNAIYEVVSTVVVPAPVTSRPLSAPAEERVKDAEADVSIEAERVASEGKKLDKEVKKYDDGGTILMKRLKRKCWN